MATCRPDHLSLVSTDCTKPPCYAVFRVERDDSEATGANRVLGAFTRDCATWRDRYGSTVDRYTRGSLAVECDDGHEEWLVLLGSDRALAPLAVDRPERFDLLKEGP